MLLAPLVSTTLSHHEGRCIFAVRHQMSPFQRHCSYTPVYTTLQSDERKIRINNKKLMKIDQSDNRNPPSIIIKLSKAFDNVHASKSDPDRPFPVPQYLHSTYLTTNRLYTVQRYEKT